MVAQFSRVYWFYTGLLQGGIGDDIGTKEEECHLPCNGRK